MGTLSNPSLNVREFLLSLFADLANDKNFEPRFKGDHKAVHQFFWTFTQDDKTKPFVVELFFDANGNYPYSEQIDELLQEFQLSGVLSRPNPTYKYNDIAITSRSYADEFKKTLSPDQKSIYEKILDIFKEKLGVRSEIYRVR